jgi:UDP-glucose 6-dehydrogenase
MADLSRSSDPEFLREGTVGNFFHSESIVVGVGR